MCLTRVYLTFAPISSFYYSLFENIVYIYFTILLRVRFANTMRDKDSFFSPLFSMFLLFFSIPCRILLSEYQKKINQTIKKTRRHHQQRSNLFNCIYTHQHTAKQVPITNKKKFFVRLRIFGDSSTNFINYYIQQPSRCHNNHRFQSGK